MIHLKIQIGYPMKVFTLIDPYSFVEPDLVPPDSWAKGAVPVVVKPVIPEFVLDEAVDQVASSNVLTVSSK